MIEIIEIIAINGNIEMGLNAARVARFQDIGIIGSKFKSSKINQLKECFAFR